MILTLALLSASLFGVSIVLGIMLFRASRRLIEFDDLFVMLVDEIDVNVRHFEKISKMPIMSNVPEVMQAHHNMMIMNARLIEYVIRIHEIMNKPLPKKEISSHPPVVR